MWGKGILNGLRITMRNMLRGPITVQYPDERLKLPERARWAVAPLFDEHGEPKCTACMTCVRECPDHILSLTFTTGEDKSKHIEELGYEMGACMMCGLCVEACPFSALEMSHEYELATCDPERTYRVLLRDVDAARPKRAERAEGPAAPAGAPVAGAGPAETGGDDA